MLKYIFLLLFSFFWSNSLFYLLGLFFYRIPKFHKVGIKFLAMSMFQLRRLPYRCNLRACTSCRNWSCPEYMKE